MSSSKHNTMQPLIRSLTQDMEGLRRMGAISRKQLDDFRKAGKKTHQKKHRKP